MVGVSLCFSIGYVGNVLTLNVITTIVVNSRPGHQSRQRIMSIENGQATCLFRTQSLASTLKRYPSRHNVNIYGVSAFKLKAAPVLLSKRHQT